MNNISHFKSFNYETVIVQKNDIFFLYIDELNCFASDAKLEEAFTKLQKKKEELFSDYIKTNREEMIPLPHSNKKRDGKSFLASSLPFAVKYIVIVLTVILLTGYSAYFAGNQLSRGIGQSMSTLIQSNVSNMNYQLMDFANKIQIYLETLPVEEREKMRVRWGRKWNSLRPIIGEFIAIVSEEIKEQNGKITEPLQENVPDPGPDNEK